MRIYRKSKILSNNSKWKFKREIIKLELRRKSANIGLKNSNNTKLERYSWKANLKLNKRRNLYTSLNRKPDNWN